METWVLCCKLYPEQHRVGDNRLARPSPRGGLTPGAIPGLDRWLSKQNPAYRSVSYKKDHTLQLMQVWSFWVGVVVYALRQLHRDGERTDSPENRACIGRCRRCNVGVAPYRNLVPFTEGRTSAWFGFPKGSSFIQRGRHRLFSIVAIGCFVYAHGHHSQCCFCRFLPDGL